MVISKEEDIMLFNYNHKQIDISEEEAEKLLFAEIETYAKKHHSDTSALLEQIEQIKATKNNPSILGIEGIYSYAIANNIPPTEVLEMISHIKNLEQEIIEDGYYQYDISSGENKKLMEYWLERYVEFFNKYAKNNKQAYIILGNIASGKSTYGSKIEKETESIIIDPDRYKMGEETEHGFFEGLSSLFHNPIDRERLQEPCSLATKHTLDLISDAGMNIILPKATSKIEKLEKQISMLTNKGYEVHLILVDTPLAVCANRNYVRYISKEFQRDKNTHGRFVPISVIYDIGDGAYETFAKALTSGKFKKCKMFYSDNKINRTEEVDLESLCL